MSTTPQESDDPELLEWEQKDYCVTMRRIFDLAKQNAHSDCQGLTLEQLALYYPMVKIKTKATQFEAPVRGMISRWRRLAQLNLPETFKCVEHDCIETGKHRVHSCLSGRGKVRLYWL